MKRIRDKDAISIWDHFKELEDPRSSVNGKHLLGDPIVIAVCAVLAGADGPQAIGIWAHNQEGWLRRFLELPHGIRKRPS